MPQQRPNDIVRAGAEVRGTQSFVYIMASVFRRPSLTALEIAWRWAIGIPLIGLLVFSNQDAWQHGTDPRYWHDLGEEISHGGFIVGINIAGVTCLIAIILVWAAVSGLARDVLLRRLDPCLHQCRLTGAALAMMRVSSFAILVAAWIWLLTTTWLHLTWEGDPNYVLGFAIVVITTLLLFFFWSLISWIFPLAVILSMQFDLSVGASLRAAWHGGAVRGKLIEINLVMGIVKVALIVLAMVFSATPLPFQSFTTQGFLWSWWTGIALLYLLASDFFHVVRLASSLALCRVYNSR